MPKIIAVENSTFIPSDSVQKIKIHVLNQAKWGKKEERLF